MTLEEVEGQVSPPKDEAALKKGLGRLADAHKRLAGKAVEALDGRPLDSLLSIHGP